MHLSNLVEMQLGGLNKTKMGNIASCISNNIYAALGYMFSIKAYELAYGDLHVYKIVKTGYKYEDTRSPMLYVLGLNVGVALLGVILGIVYTSTIKFVIKNNSKLKLINKLDEPNIDHSRVDRCNLSEINDQNIVDSYIVLEVDNSREYSF